MSLACGKHSEEDAKGNNGLKSEWIDCPEKTSLPHSSVSAGPGLAAVYVGELSFHERKHEFYSSPLSVRCFVLFFGFFSNF